ncbi:hypothetical protein [Streptomyces luteogriseus]|uniref:Uncharacterized protein n=1 Tax=Streptomyces luteogriseus TaxID=68233 RepID=A0A7W7DGA3_9ACTN|nr:hypothetical protein [Streptomyces luteogriseus]MBB4710171.1 hypothetical protein [Streptomyces luteogriseus]
MSDRAHHAELFLVWAVIDDEAVFGVAELRTSGPPQNLADRFGVPAPPVR